MRFTPKVCEQLKHYVYLYVDPRDSRPFYIGMGVNNRCFAHLKDRSESAKVNRIAELEKLGYEPRIEILRHGMSKAESLCVEAAAIDLVGIEQLTNIIRGHGDHGPARIGAKDLALSLDAKPAVIKDPVLLINISQVYRFGMSDMELYDATRSAWVVGNRRNEIRYALAVYRSIVREVYEVAGWIPGGSTMRADPDPHTEAANADRYEFVGRIAQAPVRKRYCGKSVTEYFPKGMANPVRYAGC